MNLQARRKFIGLAVHHTNGHPQLCHICRFFELGTPDEDGHIDEFDCLHPIEKVRTVVFDSVLRGRDCWAFRPETSNYFDVGWRRLHAAPPSIEQAEQIADEYLAELTGEKFG